MYGARSARWTYSSLALRSLATMGRKMSLSPREKMARADRVDDPADVVACAQILLGVVAGLDQ